MAVATWVGGDGTGSEQTDYGRAANWSGGVVPDADDHVIVANTGHNCKLDANRDAASLTVNSGATLDGSGAKLSIKSEGTASEGTDGFAVNIDGIIAGNLDLEINTPAATNIDLKPSPATHFVRNVTINHASCAAAIADGFMTISGDLTITAGSLNTGGNDLTVAGALANDGTLTLNGSTVNLGSTSAQAGDFQGSGTFNFDTSTINFHTGGTANFNPSTSANFDTNTSTLNLIGLDSSTRAHNFKFNSGNMHNVTTSRGAGSGTHIDKLAANCTITGDLTVGVNSKFSSGTRVFTVNGDVSVTGELDCDDSDKPMTFGSLTIASGGTYSATSGTTTITGKNSFNYMFDNNGTFTHNNGTVHWKADTSSGTWFAMDGSTGATPTSFYNISTERVRASGTEQYRFWTGGAGRVLTVLNNIDIGANTSIYSSNGSGVFNHFGNCYIRGTTGGLNLDNVTTVNMGTVTIESGGTLEFADGNSINVEGIRNIGGTVQAT
jgi:hypothetical protein